MAPLQPSSHLPPDLSIVIVNWNVAELLTQCLISIKEHSARYETEVWVIDNASQDDSLEVLRRDFPWVRVIANSENVGFAKANNQAFRLATGHFILTLNPDTQLQEGALENMVEVLKANPDIGIVGPRISSPSGSIVKACKRKAPSIREFSKNLFLTESLLDFSMSRVFPNWWSRIRDRPFFQSEPCSCIQGSCMLMRRVDLLKVGFFDERIPLYLDDNDLCTRFENAGFKVFYHAGAHVLHKGAGSVSKLGNSRMSSLVGSMALDMYFLKHGSRWQIVLHHFLLVISSIVFLGVDLILLPVLSVTHPKFIKNYIVKHWWSLSYGLFFRFRSSSLPRGWPHSLQAALKASENTHPTT